MKLETILVADAVSAPPDGKFYLHGAGITRFNVPQLPTIVHMGILARFELDEHEPYERHRIAIHLTDPNEVDLLKGGPELWTDVPTEPPQHVEGEQRFLALVINLDSLVIQQEGMHHLQIDLDGVTIRAVPLPVVLLTPPGQFGVERFARPLRAPEPPA
jgi:hypothetical protein